MVNGLVVRGDLDINVRGISAQYQCVFDLGANIRELASELPSQICAQILARLKTLPLPRLLLLQLIHAIAESRPMATKTLLLLPPAFRLNIATTTRAFSVLSRPSPNYKGHVPLNLFERGTLVAGSAILSLINPKRAGTGLLPPVHSSCLLI